MVPSISQLRPLACPSHVIPQHHFPAHPNWQHWSCRHAQTRTLHACKAQHNTGKNQAGPCNARIPPSRFHKTTSLTQVMTHSTLTNNLLAMGYAAKTHVGQCSQSQTTLSCASAAAASAMAAAAIAFVRRLCSISKGCRKARCDVCASICSACTTTSRACWASPRLANTLAVE